MAQLVRILVFLVFMAPGVWFLANSDSTTGMIAFGISFVVATAVSRLAAGRFANSQPIRRDPAIRTFDD